jgi:hypothetical protein
MTSLERQVRVLMVCVGIADRRGCLFAIPHSSTCDGESALHRY